GGLCIDRVRTDIEGGYFKIAAFVCDDVTFELRACVHDRNGNARHKSAALVGHCAQNRGPAALREHDCRNEKEQSNDKAYSRLLHSEALLDLLYCSSGAGGSQRRLTRMLTRW